MFRRLHTRNCLGALLPGLAVATLALLHQTGALSRQVANGGRMMAGLKLTRFHTTKTFLDLASVRAADGAYLVTIEHLYQEPKSWHDALTERTAWRFWRCAEPGNMLRQSSESTVTAPSAISASASISKNKLSALIESNQEHAAFLLTWNLVPSQPVQVPESSPAL